MKIEIKGMSCGHCVKAVKEALERLKGVTKVDVSLEGGFAEVEGDFNLQEAKDTINDLGFDA